MLTCAYFFFVLAVLAWIEFVRCEASDVTKNTVSTRKLQVRKIWSGTLNVLSVLSRSQTTCNNVHVEFGTTASSTIPSHLLADTMSIDPHRVQFTSIEWNEKTKRFSWDTFSRDRRPSRMIEWNEIIKANQLRIIFPWLKIELIIQMHMDWVLPISRK